MELEERLLILTEIKLSSEYKSKRKTSTSFILPLYILLPLTLPLLLLSLFSYYNMSQLNLIQME